MELINKYETMVALRISIRVYDKYIAAKNSCPDLQSFNCALCLLQSFRAAKELIDADKRLRLDCGDCPLFDNIEKIIPGVRFGPLCCKEWNEWFESNGKNLDYIIAIRDRMKREYKKLENQNAD